MEKIKALIIKYKEFILYVLFGVVTTIANYGVYFLCGHVLHMDVVPANAIAWVAAVLVAYVTNKLWVFNSKSWKLSLVAKELGEFALGRLITLGIETLLLWVFVDCLHVNDLIMKIITNIIVVIVNYIFSKFIIFKKKEPEQANAAENGSSETL